MLRSQSNDEESKVGQRQSKMKKYGSTAMKKLTPEQTATRQKSRIRILNSATGAELLSHGKRRFEESERDLMKGVFDMQG